MAKDLEEALINIEIKLGGNKLKLTNLGEHLEYIESLISGGGGGGGISFVIVDELPTTGESKIIYFVPKKTLFSRNKYDEYVWIDNDWEYIGTGVIDPTGYATIEYVDTELLKKQNKLTFNVNEVPVTAKTLNSIKDGDEVYIIEPPASTVDWTDVTNKPDFKQVATTGDYDDLDNKPLNSISISQTVLPGTGTRPETTTTSVTLDGNKIDIVSYTQIDSALSSSSKNPVANHIIFNAISNKIDAEDFQDLEKIALTTRGVMSGTSLSPVLSISDGNYYPINADSNKRWRFSKADSATFFKIYDVSQYTTIHLKSVSRAGHILTNSTPSVFSEKIHQNPTQTSSWLEYPEESGTPVGTNSEQADILPKTGFTPYDKDLTTNGKHYLIVYEVNAAQAIEVTSGGGYSPIYTGMFVNNGDGSTPLDPYAKVSQITVTDVQTSDGTSIVNNKIATLPSVYAHHIYIIGGNGNKTNIYCTLLTNSATLFNLSSFITYINNMATTSTIMATGTIIYSSIDSTDYCRTVAAISPGVAANNSITIIYHDTDDAGVVKNFTVQEGTGNLDLTSLIDTIIKIF